MARDRSPTYKPKSSAKGRSGSSGGGKKKKGGGGGGKSPNAYARAAEKRAIARENKAKAKAAARYREQAKTLGLQVKALQRSLGSEGFIKALNQRLANAKLVYGQQDAALSEGYEKRVDSLEDATDANAKAGSDATFANFSNRARERAAAVSEAMAAGAGESDVLRTTMMSLRNWQANQSDVSRAFFDGLQSINSSLTDLTVDTKTARLNAESQYNNDQDQLWTDYFNRRSETYTQLGNVQGQVAELYGMANEQKSSGSSKSGQKKASSASGRAFMDASKTASMAWKNPGNSKALREWKGADAFEGRNNTSILSDAGPAIPAPKKPEGSSLREWA